MTKKILAILFFCIIILACFIGMSGCSTTNQIYLPEENQDYVINNYNVDITVDENKTLLIKESITATFTDCYKGIVRYIPIDESVGEIDENGNLTNTKNYKNTISDFVFDHDNSSSGMSLIKTQTSSGYKFYYLGSYSNFIGTKTFTFSYKLNPGDDRDTSKDSFYFNIVGTGWDTKIEKLNWTIIFPSSTSNLDYYIYQGRIGQDATGQKATLNGNTISSSATNLDYGEAVTLKIDFEEGYFSFNRSYLYDIILLTSFFVLLVLIFVLFAKYRKKEIVVDVVEFSAPENLTPTEAGFVYDGAVQGKDLSSLLVYWADKGYLQIIDKGKNDAEFKKLKDLPENAKIHEKIYFNSLFENRETFTLKSLGQKEGNAALSAKKSVDMTNKNYFVNSGKNVFFVLNFLVLTFLIVDALKLGFAAHQFWYGASRIIFAIVFFFIIKSRLKNPEIEKTQKLTFRIFKYIFFALLFIGFYLLNLLYTEAYCDLFYTRLFFIVLPITLFFTIAHLEYRTKKGREHLGKLNGLKTYIEVAEKDKLEALVKDNPKIFYHILPYAYVLGVSEVYINKFKDIPIGSPDYLVTSSPLSTILTLNLLNNSLNLVSINLATYLPSVTKSIIRTVGTVASTGRTFTGGGFSGGGFGGGGGGAFK